MIVGGILSTTGMAIFYASNSLLMFIIGAIISGEFEIELADMIFL